MTSPAPSRLYALDGLRGVAALVVVVHHYCCTFFPHAVFGAQGLPGLEWQDALCRSPLFVFYNGTFAVFIFFVLSGFVISQSASATKVSLFVMVGRRYARLTVPMLCSTILVYILLKIFPDVTQAAAQQIGSGWLKTVYWRDVSLFQATWDAVFNPYRFGESYTNKVLWTMQTELFGSLAIYAIYALLPARFVPPVFLLLFLVLAPGYLLFAGYLSFVGGALLYQAHTRQWLRAGIHGPVLVLVGLALGGVPIQATSNVFFESIFNGLRLAESPADLTLCIGAIAIVSGVLMWPAAEHVLGNRPCRWLGRISFTLYLIHLPVLATLFLFVYLHLGSGLLPFAILSVGYFAATLAIAFALTILVDEPTISTLRSAAQLPRSIAFYGVHVLLFVLLGGFMISRIGVDVRSLAVAAIAYCGLFVVIPLAVWRQGPRRLPILMRKAAD